MTDPADRMCREIVELVTDYLEGVLPNDERAAFERHLAGCEGCTAYIVQMRVVIRSAAAVEPAAIDPVPQPSVRRRLIEAYRAVRGAAGDSGG